MCFHAHQAGVFVLRAIEIAQQFIHYAIGTGGRESRARALPDASEIIHHGLNQRLLNLSDRWSNQNQ